MKRMVALSTLLICAGCPDVDQVSVETAREAQPPLPASPPSPPHRDDGPVHLVLDGTRSMAGYVSCPGPDTEFKVVLARLATNLTNGNVTVFGVPEAPRASLAARSREPTGPFADDQTLSHAYWCPEAYTRLNNPDYLLVQRALQDTSGAVSLYVSDGVQSAQDVTTPSPTVRALQEWLESGRVLGIVAYRGRFRGALWSEQVQDWTDTVDVPDRPFYAFVLAPSARRLDEVLGSMPRVAGTEPVKFRFVPGERIRCSAPLAVVATARREDLNVSVVDPAATKSLLARPTSIAHYRCDLPAGHALQAVNATITSRYERWNGSTLAVSNPPAGSRIFPGRSTLEPNGSAMDIVADLDEDLQADAGRYVIDFTPVAGELRKEIAAYSTEADADTSAADRTYRFEWLIDNLVRAQFRAQTSPSRAFLTLKYR